MIAEACMCTSSELFYVLPYYPTNVSCPSQPCITLSHDQHLLNRSNAKFLFLSGRHRYTSTIIMQHVYNVTMVGISYDSLAPPAILSDFGDPVMVFINVSNVTIANLVFENCGGYDPERKSEAFYVNLRHSKMVIAGVIYSTCFYCNVTNVTLLRYGLVAENFLGKCYLNNITLYVHATEHCMPEWCGQDYYYLGIKFINYGNSTSPHYVSHNLIYMSKITITGKGGTNRNTCPLGITIGINIYSELDESITTMILSDSNFHDVDNVKAILKIMLTPSIFSTVFCVDKKLQVSVQ